MSNPTKAQLLGNPTKAQLLDYIDELHETLDKELGWLLFSWSPARRTEPLAPVEVVRELTRLRDILWGGE